MFNKVRKDRKRNKTGIIIIAATAFVAFTAGCGSSPSATSSPTSSHSVTQQNAGDFAKEYIERAELGQWGREWSTLHPAEQKIVSRDAFMSCRSDDAIPAMTDITVVDEYKEPVEVVGLGDVPSTAVTIKLKMEGDEQSFTVHAIAVNGSWHWVMPTDGIATYKAGNCPAT